MRVVSLFSGIGAFEKALTNLGVKTEVVRFCEIDRYASDSYCNIHGVFPGSNLGDVTTASLKYVKHIDLLTYGFPCQDISVAGKQEGLEKGETRSGLVWEALRLIGECQPRVAICENVKNLISAKFNYSFSSILRTLDEMGYNSYVEVLNAKDFGVPQNRERVFIVSIRKDCDNGEFKFPVGMDCGIRLKDVLEETVDEKYYISSEKVEQFLATNTLNKNSEGINMLGLLDIKGNEQVRRVYGTEGLSPTLNTMGGGNRQPKVLQYPRIRKLTPLECWRLMGFTDKDFYKAKFTGNSNTQLYKQAGNSIVVNVLEEIFVKLYEGGIFGGNNL